MNVEEPLRYYVAERIEKAEVISESFVRDPAFDINQHAQKAFGTNDSEESEVIWQFKPTAAEHARPLIFTQLRPRKINLALATRPLHGL